MWAWIAGVLLVIVLPAVLVGWRSRHLDHTTRGSRPARPDPSGGPVMITDEDITITAVHPPLVRPRVAHSLLVFAHRLLDFVDSENQVRSPREVIDELADREFGEAQRHTQVSPAIFRVAHADDLTIAVSIEGAVVWPASSIQSIREPVQRFPFRFEFENVPSGGRARGEVTALIGPIIVATIPLEFGVTHQPIPPAPPRHSSAKPYTTIFPSYSRLDVEIVEAIERAATSIGTTYLRDVTTLRSGEEWDPRLLELIEQADIFQLFWSNNSMRSPNVRREWEHALSLQRSSFIRPLRWEDPFPEDPAAGLPPPALRALHFYPLPWPGPAAPQPVPVQPVPAPPAALPSAPTPPVLAPIPAARHPRSPATDAAWRSPAGSRLRNRVLLLVAVALALAGVVAVAIR